jgi:hypothetical protein
MIAEIEAAVADYLRDTLTLDDTLTDDTWRVSPATAGPAAPKSKALIVVTAQSAPQTFPQLVEAMIEVTVVTPADVTALAAMHTLFEQAVDNAFSEIVHDGEVASNIGTELTARLPDWQGGGIAVTGWQTGREETNYTPSFSLKVGLVRI